MASIFESLNAATKAALSSGVSATGGLGAAGTSGGAAALQPTQPVPTPAPVAPPAVNASAPAGTAPTNANVNTMATPSGTPLASPTIGSAPAPAAGQVPQLGQPEAWAVTPDQTVEGRIASILAANNPIIQGARTRALEAMNGRGLLNSSMAIGAGEQAAQTAALPIAQADAATHAKAASYNADEKNQFGIQNLAAQLKGFDAGTQKDLQQMSLDNQKLLQTNNQAATAFNQALVSMTNINMNDKMDGNAKTQAIAQVQRDLQSQLKVLSATTGLGLSNYLNFSGYDGFDATGNYVGFSGNGTAAPAPAAASPDIGYTGYGV